MVALARAVGRPAPEAVMTALAQPIALAIAAQASTLVAAVAGYALVTTAASLVLWQWLKRALALEGLAWRDVAALAAVTITAALAAGLSRAAAEAMALHPWLVLAVVAACTLSTAGLLAVATGAVSPEERHLLLRLGRRR
jgi:hypothetical protein